MEPPERALVQHVGSLLHFLDSLLADPLYSDLSIVCEDGVLPSYRVLLAACSDLVSSCLAGSQQEQESATLILPGVTLQEMRAFHSSLLSFGVTPKQESLDGVLKILGTIGVNIGPYIDIDVRKTCVESALVALEVGDIGEGTMTIPDEVGLIPEEKSSSDILTDPNQNQFSEADQIFASNTAKSTKKLEYACLFCDKMYRSIGPYERHLAQHRQEPQVKDLKEEEVEETTTFTLDVNEKDEIVSCPRLKCDKCGLDFDSEADYSKHQKIDCTKSHLCSICHKCFSSTQTLTNHVKLHTKELEFSCELCEKQFVSRSVLGNHMKTHDQAYKIPRFNCPHCLKKFTHPSNLKRHIRTAHFEMSDKKTYDCTECGKSFRDPSALKHHLKTHMEVRPFPCAACPKSFGSKTQLENHQRIHTGEKPFLCNMCGRCFVTKGQLKSHKLNRHVGVKYQKCHLCPECGQSFVKEFDLKGKIIV